MIEKVDWTFLAVDHMFSRHQVAPGEATEAVNDVDVLWFDPDPRSRSGLSVRVIGYSQTARAILTVILLHADTELAGSGWYGVNGWRSNSTDSRRYREEAEE
ncbi:hypothetical protein QOZ88_01460 [Blastococcus sp. BMG 814]|uniref:Transposase n=1 Tax=Blastococcus carthaginiensis TaxID=3050034 RepID=A0ABT9I6U8_9ACTN|nr:hypothetical protein [Blastococcus carthaginiensis]MDP5181292.1 hypothetical protein [Blastococcus carthaginiensis]